MLTREIRTKFLKYFEKNGHTIVESSSLVPQNDPTLLFTNAGMVQFKDVFLGKDSRPYTRATSSQKCVRAGGKHNDLENVGFTARHHTYFEMLGNFSFGDYFKKDAIHFAWEFVTRELNLSQNSLYVSVFEKDDEAADIWHKQEGISRDHIFKFGEKDNFWAMGDTGPCGPCSEIFIDRGEKYSCGRPTCGMGCDCDRFMEFWNLVFMQFNRDSDGRLTALPKPSVDTGAGLERLASILQNVDTNYDTDGFRHIIDQVAKLAGHSYSGKHELAVSFRVIADHARATTFLIGDGVLPSNEGRGYVLRRIMRRAIRHGKKLGFQGPFLHKVTEFIIEQMREAYPDLIEKRSFIEKAVFSEEEQFFKTLERGLALMDEEAVKLAHNQIFPGDVAFKLYDTYGFPIDLTRVICAEKGLNLDETGFKKAMDHQRMESRKHWKGSGQEGIEQIYFHIAHGLRMKKQLPCFIGYDHVQAESECMALLVSEGKMLKSVPSYSVSPLDESLIEAVFSETPFYPEGGGQVGDRGRLTGGDGFEAEVIDVQRPVPDLVVVHLRPLKGTIQIGRRYLQETDNELRALTARNHTATHLLHWALREVLGKHVKQAGSLVAPDLLRFDFTHFHALTVDEIQKIENLINEKIWKSEPVIKTEMNKNEALAQGAVAFFGEKYGDLVRVVQIGNFSTELCGGTHVHDSSDIHLFKIVSESGIAAGVRRIIAYTSKGAFDYLRKKMEMLELIRDHLKATHTDEILGRIDKMATQEKELRLQVEQLRSRSAAAEAEEMLRQAFILPQGRIVTGIARSDLQGVKRLRDLADQLKQKSPDALIVIGIKDDTAQKVFLLVCVGPQAPQKIQAHELIKKLAPLIDGKGGGKADLAQAGGAQLDGLSRALEQAKKLICDQLSY